MVKFLYCISLVPLVAAAGISKNDQGHYVSNGSFAEYFGQPYNEKIDFSAEWLNLEEDSVLRFRDALANQFSSVVDKTDFVFNLTYMCNIENKKATDLILTLQDIDRTMNELDSNWTDLVDVYGSGKYDADNAKPKCTRFPGGLFLAIAKETVGEMKQNIIRKVLDREEWRENTYYIPKDSDKCCISWTRQTRVYLPFYSTADQECVWKCYSNSGGPLACKAHAQQGSDIVELGMTDFCLFEIDSKFRK